MNKMIATYEDLSHADTQARAIGFGVPDLDARLNGGLAQGTVHEFYGARFADSVAMTGLGLILTHKARDERKTIWIRQDGARFETGTPSATGLESLGLSHSNIILIETKDMASALSAALDGARCSGLASLFLETWGEHKAFDLTASRKLSLAARQADVTLFMARHNAKPTPSSAQTRWRVACAPSQALAANAPGYPCFDLTLERHRSSPISGQDQTWRVEWNYDTHSFALIRDLKQANTRPIPDTHPNVGSSLSGFILPLPVNRPVEASEEPLRHAS